MAQAAAAAAQAIKSQVKKLPELHGVVVSAGLMDKTVKVRVGGQKWNNYVKKFFDDPKQYLVHDPCNSLRLGDVVAIEPGWRTSKQKRHVVKYIIAPGSGVPIDQRPPIPTQEERLEEKAAKRYAKVYRRTLRKTAEKVESSLEVAERILRKGWREFEMRKGLIEQAEEKIREREAELAAKVAQ